VRLDTELLAEAAVEARLAPVSLAFLPLDLAAAPMTIDPDRLLYPASMIKVPLVAAALTDLASGHLASLESTVEVTAENMTANDAASPLVPGYRATLHELMHLAISRSDNVATNVLFDLVGRQRATQIAQERLGLPATVFARKLSGSEPLIEDPGWDGTTRNSHTVTDALHLFRTIADDAVEHAAILREMLADAQWNDKLSRGLRDGDRFLHKTGDTEEVTHDGGILYTQEGRRYVVVVYTQLPSTDEHSARFGTFMQTVRELL